MHGGGYSPCEVRAITAARAIIDRLALAPHPEGGHFREVHRHAAADGGRGAMSSILYLLAEGESSHWHRVDADEVWHFHAGAPLELAISEDGRARTAHRLGPDPTAGDEPQVVVPALAWQSARSTGAWTLVGCTVGPAFEFDGFELAPPGWEPGD